MPSACVFKIFKPFKPFISHNLMVKITIYTHTIDKFKDIVGHLSYNSFVVRTHVVFIYILGT